MEKQRKDKHTKFIIGVVTFAVIFFLLLSLLTNLSGTIDSLLYPTVTASFTYTGSLDKDTNYESYNTLVPTSAIHNNRLYYLVKNSDNNYIVASMPIEIINQNPMQTEIGYINSVLAICNCNKDIKVGDQVLVKADII